MALFDTIRAGASGAAGDFTVERSFRFDSASGTYLQRTPSSAGNRQICTFSCWVKRGDLNTTNCLASAYSANNDNDNISMNLRQLSSGNCEFRVAGYFYNFRVTNKLFRDVSAWYHIVVAFDTTQSSADDRIKIYINGAQETSFSTSGNVTQNMNIAFNDTSVHRIAAQSNALSNHMDGYMAEVNFIDGLQLDPSSFGETDATTGQWNPKKYTGSYGTNGYYLDFSDNSSITNMCLDKSGNGNNFSPDNCNTEDSMLDTPTNNFAVAQMMGTPFSSGASFSEGNLKLVTGSSASARNLNRSAFAPMLVNSGKWYAEFMPKSSDQNIFIGVGPYQVELSPTVNNTRYAYVRVSDGKAVYRTAGSETIATYGSAIGQNNVLGVYLDMDAGTPVVYFSKNGQWADGSGNFDESSPTSGITLGDSFFTTDTGGNDGFASFIFSSSSGGSSVTIHANFGQDSTFAGQISSGGNVDASGIGNFKYAVPTGAKALCSANLPDPTIKLPNEHFNTLLYTGDDSNDRDITGVGFQPDWLWIKNRQGQDWHMLQDAVRGANKTLFSNRSESEDTDNTNGHVNSFLADGFNVTAGASGNVNENNENYVAWNWNAGGSTVTNNNGTISTQVRANTTAGFSIVTYTGNGSTSATIGHGLGVKPDLIYIKNRSSSVDWVVMHSSNPSYDGGNYKHQPLKLNTNDALVSILGIFSTPNSSTQSISDGQTSSGNRPLTNTSGSNYVAYFFSSVAGYSKAGSYTGNGSTDGTFIFVGFRPAYIILKRTNSAAAWIVHDNRRAGYNGDNDYLQPDDATADSDGSSGTLDILSNGFKLRSTPGTHNGSGDTFIYFAIAESSFKYARAR